MRRKWLLLFRISPFRSFKKEGLITNLRFKKEELEEELKKCIVLCSNCHRKEHKYDYLKTIPKYLNKKDYV